MLAGGGPAATYFSCLAKKSKQKKGAAEVRHLYRRPFGVPKRAGAKAGSAETRLRLRHPRFFIRLALRFFGVDKGATHSLLQFAEPVLLAEINRRGAGVRAIAQP